MSEFGSVQLTAAYVEQLKSALKLKNEECQQLHEANMELSEELSHIQEEMKELESQRSFEMSRAELAMSCNKTNADPSHVVRIVSSWLPQYTDATMACCIKVGESWIIVEEEAESQRIYPSTILDETVLQSEAFNGDAPGADIIPESVLRSLGWSHSHESLAITLYSRCVWVIIGVGAKEAARVALGFHSILATATELIMSSVLHQMEKCGEYNKLCRIETSLEMCRLLLSTSQLVSSHHTSSSESGISESISSVSIWKQLPRAMEMCVEDVQCDIILFHKDSLGGTTMLSTSNGVSYRSAASTASGSLTEKAIGDGTELLVCNDRHNISRDRWIDCGDGEVAALAVAPIWPQASSSQSGNGLINFSGAVLFRLENRSFTEAEIDIMMEVVRDNFGLLRDWMDANVCDVIGSLGNAANSETAAPSSTNRLPPNMPSPGVTFPRPDIALVRQCLEWYLDRPVPFSVGLESASIDQRGALVRMMATCFQCEWAVLVLPVGGEASSQREFQVVNDLGGIGRVCLSSDGIDTDSLSQALKFLQVYESSVRAKEEREKHPIDYNKKTCVTLNNIFSSSTLAEDSQSQSKWTTFSSTKRLLNSLLSDTSPFQQQAQPSNPLSALVPSHLMCTSLVIRGRGGRDGSTARSESDSPSSADETVLVLAGRTWAPLSKDEVCSSRQEVQSVLKLMDECREKDSLFSLADRLAEHVRVLEEAAEAKSSADECLESFSNQLAALQEDSNIGRRLLEAMNSHKKVVFGYDSVLQLCVSEEVTRRQWSLGNMSAKGHESACWVALETQFAAAVDWTDCKHSVSFQDVKLHRTLSAVSNAVTGRSLSGYCLYPLHSEEHGEVRLDLTLVVFTNHTEEEIDYHFVANWMTVLMASLVPCARSLLHPDHRSSSSGNKYAGLINDADIVHTCNTYVTSIATECVSLLLSDHSWMDSQLVPLVGRLPQDMVSEDVIRSSVWGNISYLCSKSLWQYLASSCHFPVRVAIPAIAVPLIKGSSGGAEYCMFDLLRYDQDMSSQMQEAIHKAVKSTSGHVSSGASVTSTTSGRERRGSLTEFPHCVHHLEKEKSVVQVFSGRSAIGELVYRHLLNSNDNQEFTPQDTVIVYSHIIDESEADRPYYIHVVLVAQARHLMTPQDLCLLESVLGSAFSPLDIIRAHDSVKHDIRMMRDLIVGDSKLKHRDVSGSQSTSAKLFQKQHSSEWSIVHSHTEKTLKNMLYMCLDSAQASARQVNSSKRGFVTVLDAASYLFDGSELLKCAESSPPSPSLSSPASSPKKKTKQRAEPFPECIRAWQSRAYGGYDRDPHWGDDGSGSIHIETLPYQQLHVASGVDGGEEWEDESTSDNERNGVAGKVAEVATDDIYVIRLSISDSINEIGVVLIRVKWEGAVDTTSRSRVRVDELLSRHGYSQLRLLATASLQTLLRDNTLREAHETMVHTYTSRIDEQRDNSVKCVSRIDEALSNILNDSVGIADIFHTLDKDKDLRQKVDKERRRRDSLVSYFDAEAGAGRVSDEKHSKMIENCFGDIEKKTDIIRKAISAAKATIESKTNEITGAHSDITSIKSAMTNVESELSVLESRHVSFVEQIISSVEVIEKRLHVSHGAGEVGNDDGAEGQDWGDENTLYDKLAMANDLSTFYYNLFLHLLGALCDKGLTTEALQCLNQSDILRSTNFTGSEGGEGNADGDMWSIVWLPYTPNSSSGVDICDHLDVVGDVPYARDVASMDAVEQARLEHVAVTTRVTSRSFLLTHDRHRFVTYWPVYDDTDPQRSVHAVIQQIHESENPLQSPQQTVMKMGLCSTVTQIVQCTPFPHHHHNSWSGLHRDPSVSKSPPTSPTARAQPNGNESIVLTGTGLVSWADLFKCTDAFEPECEFTQANAQYFGRIVLDVLAGSVGDGCRVGIATRYTSSEQVSSSKAYAVRVQSVGSGEAVDSDISEQELMDLLGKGAVTSSKTLLLSYCNSALGDLLQSSSTAKTVTRDDKMFRLVSVLNEVPEYLAAMSWAYIIIESHSRPGYALLANVQAVSNSLRSIRDVLHKRHLIDSTEKRLIETNEALVKQINLSENFLNHLERKQAQWQSCCSIAASLPDPPRVDTTIRKGRVFSPSPISAKNAEKLAGGKSGYDGEEDESDHRSRNLAEETASWQYVWNGDAIADKKRIVDRLKAALASLQADFVVAISGIDAVDVTISRIDSSVIAEVREDTQTDSSEGSGGIFPFSKDHQTMAKLSMGVDGHVVKSRSDSSFASLLLSRLCAVALLSNAVVESSGGVKGDHRPVVVVPIGTFSSPLGGWTVVLQFKDAASWNTYVSSNVSSSKLRQSDSTDNECKENIYQNTVWLAKILRQWLRGIELEREANVHRNALHYVRGVSVQIYQAIATINHLTSTNPITDMSSAAALVESAFLRCGKDDEGAEDGSVKSRSIFLPTGTGAGEHLNSMFSVHEEGFDDNILRVRLHWSRAYEEGVQDHEWHMVRVNEEVGAERLHLAGSPSKSTAASMQWNTQSSFVSSTVLQRAIVQGLIVCDERDTEPRTPQKGRHSSSLSVRILFCVRNVPGNNVVMEVTVRVPDIHTKENLLISSLSTDGHDCVAPLTVLAEYIGSMLRGSLMSNALSADLTATTLEESRHLDRLNVMVRCLQELHVPKGHLIPVVTATEKILAELPGCIRVRIQCVDETDGHILYAARQHSDESDDLLREDLSGGGRGDVSRLSPIFLSGDSYARSLAEDSSFKRSIRTVADGSFETGGRLHIDSLASPANKFQSINKKQNDQFKYLVEFQVYEVKGTVSVEAMHELSSVDRAILQALIKAAGRRIYELYRGKRHKKAYAELQREHEKTSWTLRQREIENGELNQNLAALRDEVQQALADSERFKGLLRSEGTALEAARKMKRDAEHHFKQVLDECKSEFQKKERALNKTLEALKRQCEHLKTQLLEESKSQAAVTEDLKTVADRATKIDRRRKDLETTLASSRSEYEGRIRDLQAMLSQYQSEILTMEREHALEEEKLKSACQISEERVKTALERVQAMEQEVAATRSSTLFLKQQLDATSRALKMSQDELERHKMREMTANHHLSEGHSNDDDTRRKISSQSNRTVVRKHQVSSRMASSSR